jgi:hypothetical protein
MCHLYIVACSEFEAERGAMNQVNQRKAPSSVVASGQQKHKKCKSTLVIRILKMANKQRTGRFCTFKSSRRLHLGHACGIRCIIPKDILSRVTTTSTTDVAFVWPLGTTWFGISPKSSWRISYCVTFNLEGMALWIEQNGAVAALCLREEGELAMSKGDCWATTTWDFESSCVDELLRGRILSHLRSVQYIRWGIIGHCQLWACGPARVTRTAGKGIEFSRCLAFSCGTYPFNYLLIRYFCES